MRTGREHITKERKRPSGLTRAALFYHAGRYPHNPYVNLLLKLCSCECGKSIIHQNLREMAEIRYNKVD